MHNAYLLTFPSVYFLIYQGYEYEQPFAGEEVIPILTFQPDESKTVRFFFVQRFAHSTIVASILSDCSMGTPQLLSFGFPSR